MEIKRTTEIFIETARRFVVRPVNENTRCLACGESLLAAEQCAALLQINCRLIFQMIERGAAHFVENPTGATLVCPTSLAAALSAESPTVRTGEET